MKKLILAIAVSFALSSCSTYRTPVSRGSLSLDYSYYSNEGFFITEANSVSFDYKPVSSVSAYFSSGYEILEKDGKKVTNTSYAGTEFFVTTDKYLQASKEYILDALVKEAKKKGANGIINLKIEGNPIYDPATMSFNDFYSGTAMAIKK